MKCLNALTLASDTFLSNTPEIVPEMSYFIFLLTVLNVSVTEKADESWFKHRYANNPLSC